MTENRDYGDEGVPDRDDFWRAEELAGRPGPPAPEPILDIATTNVHAQRASSRRQKIEAMEASLHALKELEYDDFPRSAIGDHALHHEKVAWAAVLEKCANAYRILVREEGV